MLRVDLQAIRSEIKLKGISFQAIADDMFMSRATLYSKLKGTAPFTVPELNALCRILAPDDPGSLMQIFLTEKLAESQLC